MQGRVHRLIRGKGFGFIQSEERQYFFHHSEVRETEFRRLALGDVVEFEGVDEDEEGKNPRATEITVVEKAPSPPPPTPRASRKGAGKKRTASAEPGGGLDGDFDGGDGGGSEAEGVDDEDAESFDDAFLVDDEEEFSEELPYAEGDAPGDDSAGTPTDSRRTSPPRTSARAGPRASRGRRGSGRDPEKSRRPKATGKPGDRGKGVVRSLNSARGFGFIETHSGDLFFHKSGVQDDFDALNVGAQVSFTFGEGDRGSKAEDVAAS
jgi:cold shock CspA family protein